jgi:hypothetical protein
MPRPPIPLESFDLATGWPVAVYASSLAAAAAGYQRRLIDAVIRGRQREHRGLGWKRADASSHLAEFVRVWCWERPGALPESCIPVNEFLGTYLTQQGLPLEQHYRALIAPRLQKRYGWALATYVSPLGPGAAHDHVQVIPGLVWAA